jgi:type I restriction enzyme, S subunit
MITQVTELRRVLRKLTRPTRTGDGVITAYRDGVVTLRASRRDEGYTMSAQEAGYQGVEPGDFVFHALDGFAGAVGISDSRGKSSPAYHVCDAPCGDDLRFIRWALRSAASTGYLESMAPATRQRSVDFRNWQSFGSIEIPRPSLWEQAAIAEYLDAQVALIEQSLAVVARQQLLLHERRPAVVEQALPVGRATVPLSVAVTATAGFPYDSADFVESGPTPLVRIRDLMAEAYQAYLPHEVPEKQCVQSGDAVIGMDGDFNVVIWKRGRAALNQRVCRLRPKPGWNIAFVAYQLRPQLAHLRDTQNLTTVAHLSMPELLHMRLTAASHQEQARIADCLDAQLSAAGDVLHQLAAMERLLQERKHALITACVMGEFDVSTASDRAAQAALQGVTL